MIAPHQRRGSYDESPTPSRTTKIVVAAAMKKRSVMSMGQPRPMQTDRFAGVIWRLSIKSCSSHLRLGPAGRMASGGPRRFAYRLQSPPATFLALYDKEQRRATRLGLPWTGVGFLPPNQTTETRIKNPSRTSGWGFICDCPRSPCFEGKARRRPLGPVSWFVLVGG